jgi:hypothetical protein
MGTRTEAPRVLLAHDPGSLSGDELGKESELFPAETRRIFRTDDYCDLCTFCGGRRTEPFDVREMPPEVSNSQQLRVRVSLTLGWFGPAFEANWARPYESGAGKLLIYLVFR